MPIDSEPIPPSVESDIQTPELDNTPEVVGGLEVLKQRKEAGYVRGSRSDGNYVALAMGPGGWAGEISLAMAMHLDRQGLLDQVDMLIGNSIGCVQALYVGTKQFRDCFAGVLNHMIPKGKIPKMTTLREVIFEEYPVQFDKLPDDLPIVIGVTNLDNFGTRLIRSDEVEPTELAEWAIRACHLPWLGGPPPEVNGLRYSDTGLAKPNTTEMTKQINAEAKDDENAVITHLIALENFIPSKPTIKNRLLATLYNRPVDAFIKHYDPAADPADVFKASISGGQFSDLRAYKKEFEGSLEGNVFEVDDGSGHQLSVERVYPADLEGLPGLTTNEIRRLRIGWISGRMAMRTALSTTRESAKSQVPT